ncbi:hypothetical protein [Sphingopyxis sp. PET50]|uniref:hypothetical protein n=1 Tax=Sphingopyxis sp. PET50 TaxID=2976533 RepID=UPI0021AFDEB9|nr:hypothetical protein [Sphingopyxis sp. PET50]
MMRKFTMIAAMLFLAGCGKAIELVSQTRTVAAPREEVFARMFGDGTDTGLPLVTNGGSTKLYELVVERNDPEWSSGRPETAARRP